MGDELLRILLFAAVAGFLIYRLRSVLGRRTGHERERRHPFGQRGERSGRHGEAPQAESGQDNVIQLPERGQEGAEREGAPSLSAGLTQVRIADPSFDANQFVQGAGRAFQMIVEAFANGDTATLRPLLSDDLFDEFGSEIRRRAAEGETHESRIVKLREADLLEARMEGRTALVTIKFVSDQINAVRDESGEVIEGDPETPIEVVDIWTFARNTRSSDPNWTLVETRTPN
jgi:predicted lipid-binding transport protein (Tim44 family)